MAAIVGALLAVTIASPSYAATFTVCASGCDYTTIAAAIAVANSGDTISITDATHNEANITVDKNLTIEGQGAANTAIDGGGGGGGNGPIFTVGNGVTATFQELTIRNGSYAVGGGILNFGTVTISDSALSGNSAYYGGGIFNLGTATISDSTLLGNSATYSGGGIYSGGTVTISNSTLLGNSATYLGEGGGIFSYGTLTISNSTLADNSATYSGGGVFNGGDTATISNSTLSGNSATYSGGALEDDYPGTTTTVNNSVLAGSTSGENCGASDGGTAADGGYNISDDGSCGFGASVGANGQSIGDNVDPLLSPSGLQDNGGPTQTIALQANSPAVNAVPLADCPATDQRGATRPDNGESACDIGAFELADQTPFANFSGKLEVTVSTGSFDLNSSFTLGAGSDGIDPSAEDVTLQIGPYSVTIPAGSFTQNKKGAYVYSGTIDGVALQLRINPAGGGSYTLQAEGSGASLDGIGNPVTVTLTIGNDAGSTQITAGIS
ncbi:MAG TPA: choice-of-anchor Q domain-containing protein [Candidatus Binataceae bacterium]|nr:choice-of-anchor Q domain-containing protein [Candidatus Binataceae bacterium]